LQTNPFHTNQYSQDETEDEIKYRYANSLSDKQSDKENQDQQAQLQRQEVYSSNGRAGLGRTTNQKQDYIRIQHEGDHHDERSPESLPRNAAP